MWLRLQSIKHLQAKMIAAKAWEHEDMPERGESHQMARVRTLVPGLQFDAVVDTNTAPGGIPAVNSA